MDDCARPIGIFDSGVGGLTVFRQIARRLPGESLIYFGDTARVPYGTKSPETVIRYARGCASILLAHDVKLVVVACNTASAYAVSTLQQDLEAPVIGVIEPGARAAIRESRNGCIGVIGTSGTVASGAYPDIIQKLAPDAEVFCKACPLFVPLAEEGWTTGEVPRAAARAYLETFQERSIDTLVLGCTHYPLLAEVIGETLGPAVTLVDSAEETARTVAEVITGRDLASKAREKASYRFLVSDAPESFQRIGERFLDWKPSSVEWVDF